MALAIKVYGVKTLFLARIFAVHGIFNHQCKTRKPLEPQSKIGYLATLQLQLQFIGY